MEDTVTLTRRGFSPGDFLPSLTTFVIEHLIIRWSLSIEVTFTMSSCFLDCGDSEEDSAMYIVDD